MSKVHWEDHKNMRDVSLEETYTMQVDMRSVDKNRFPMVDKRRGKMLQRPYREISYYIVATILEVGTEFEIKFELVTGDIRVKYQKVIESEALHQDLNSLAEREDVAPARRTDFGHEIINNSKRKRATTPVKQASR